MKEEKLTLA